MCDPITAVADVAAVAAAPFTGGASLEFIPAINAGISTGEHLIKGDSLGKSLGQGAISGAEAFAGQEIGGAFANTFPETAGAIGIADTGGNTLTDLAGTTSGAGSLFGPGTMGGSISNLFSSIGGASTDALGSISDSFTPSAAGTTSFGDTTISTGGDVTGSFGGGPVTGGGGAGATIDSNTGIPFNSESTNAAGATINSATGTTLAAPSLATSTTPSSGGFTPAGSASDFSANQINTQFAQGLDAGENLTNLNTDVAGASTQGSTGLGSLFSPATAASALGAKQADKTGGISDWLPSKADVGSTLLKSAVPLAALGYEASQGAPPLPAATQPLQQSGAVTAPLIQTETQAANAYNTGTLTPSQQADIDIWVQGRENELIQQLASSGVTNPASDSRYIQGMQQIQQQALAQKQAMLQQDITNAFSAAGAAGQNLGTVANAQVQNDASYQQALAAAMAALGGSVAGGTVSTGNATRSFAG